MKTLSKVIVLAIFAFYLGGCMTVEEEKAKSDAKNKLRINGITYGPVSFIKEAGKGNLPAVKLFVEGGMDINVCPSETALVSAAYYNRMNVVKYLVEQGADIDKGSYFDNPLIAAIRGGNYSIVKYLLEQGANPNCEIYDKGSPLYVASVANEAEIAQLLVDHGADVNYIQKWNGCTPLSGAAKLLGNTAVAKVLVEAGADPNYKTPTKMSVLGWAISHRKYEMANYLIKAGANANDGYPSSYASRTIIAALAWGSPDMIKTLIKNGVSVNAKAFGREPLLIWCAKNYLERAAELLIDLGADVKVTSRNGSTVMDYAIANREEGLIKKLDPNYDLSKLKSQIVDPNIQPQRNQIQNIMGGQYYEAQKTPQVQQAVKQAVQTNIEVGEAADRALGSNKQAVIPGKRQNVSEAEAITGALSKEGQEAEEARKGFDYPVDQEKLEKEIDAEIKKIEEKYSATGDNTLSKDEDNWYQIPAGATPAGETSENQSNILTSSNAGLPPETGLPSEDLTASSPAGEVHNQVPKAYRSNTASVDDLHNAISNPHARTERDNRLEKERRKLNEIQNPALQPGKNDNSPIASAVKEYKEAGGEPDAELKQISKEVNKRKAIQNQINQMPDDNTINQQYYDSTQK